MLHRNCQNVPLSTLLVRNDECDNVVAVQDRAWPRARKVLAERTRMRGRQNEWHNSFSPRPTRQRPIAGLFARVGEGGSPDGFSAASLGKRRPRRPFDVLGRLIPPSI